MPSTSTTRNRLEKQAAGENANTWGTRFNTNVTDLVDFALDGMTSITMAAGTTVLTALDYTADQSRARYLNLTGTNGTIQIPNVEKLYLVRNAGTGNAIISTGSGTTATITPGKIQWVVCEGGNIVRAGVAVTDGDKGDITVSASGETWTIDADVVTYAKLQNVSATDKLLGRSTAGAGDVEEIACTTAGRALLDDADAAAQRTTLGLATVAASASAADITAGTLAVARGGTGVTTSTGTGDVVLSANPTFTGTITAPTINHATGTNHQIAGATVAAVTSSGLAVTGAITSTGTMTAGGGAIVEYTSGVVYFYGFASGYKPVRIIGSTVDLQIDGTTVGAITGTGLAVTGLVDISAGASGQIKFPATQNASADVNTLDDYEEGTFTPALEFGGAAVGMTFNAANTAGRYTKIGRKVFAEVVVTLTAKGTSTGSAKITGLPFTSHTGQPYASCGFYAEVLTSTNSLSAVVLTADTKISLYNHSAGSSAALNDTNFNNTSALFVSITYTV